MATVSVVRALKHDLLLQRGQGRFALEQFESIQISAISCRRFCHDGMQFGEEAVSFDGAVDQRQRFDGRRFLVKILGSSDFCVGHVIDLTTMGYWFNVFGKHVSTPC